MTGNPSLSADLIADVRQLLAFPFMVNALEAGTIVAILAAVVGWYMVLRRQSFAGHTLSVMAFPGATGAALAGLPTTLGLYLVCSAAAVAIGGTGTRGGRSLGRETAAIGTIQTFGLAAGFLFLSLNSAVLGGPETLLFGTFLGVSSGQVLVLAVVALLALSVLTLIGRPLLFATIDPEVADARGVPVRALDIGFLLLLGLAVAATSQITGALLVFALLVAPAASAQLITSRPVAGLLLSVVLAVLVVWLALALAYFSIYPVGFYVTTLALGVYVLIQAGRRTARRA
ncbi:MAG TPA: metal ABC transporter permease [Solirubrobacteraceae bacterium]|jgi:zinc/manganese transport system permease protein